jgi:hypothetical protein
LGHQRGEAVLKHPGTLRRAQRDDNPQAGTIACRSIGLVKRQRIARHCYTIIVHSTPQNVQVYVPRKSLIN